MRDLLLVSTGYITEHADYFSASDEVVRFLLFGSVSTRPALRLDQRTTIMALPFSPNINRFGSLTPVSSSRAYIWSIVNDPCQAPGAIFNERRAA